MEVNQGWQVDIERHALESQIGATDDLRYANESQPAYEGSHHARRLRSRNTLTSRRIESRVSCASPTRQSQNITLKHYPGGHMFYAWQESRESFSQDMAEFYEDAVTGAGAV